jgi:hypothetical protein
MKTKVSSVGCRVSGEQAHLAGTNHPVAQISNLLYRRFPIGRARNVCGSQPFGKLRRLEALRYSRLEICATVAPESCVPGEPRKGCCA